MFTLIYLFLLRKLRAICKKAHNNYQKYLFPQNWSCNKEVITMGVFLYNFYPFIRIWYLPLVRCAHSCAHSADITSSLMDKNHIQIHPWYNLYFYIYMHTFDFAIFTVIKDYEIREYFHGTVEFHNNNIRVKGA